MRIQAEIEADFQAFENMRKWHIAYGSKEERDLMIEAAEYLLATESNQKICEFAERTLELWK